MLLQTDVTKLLGMTYPIFSAPMGDIARSALTAAVSDAGGFGMLAGALMTGDEFAAEVQRTKELTTKPFGVGLIFPSMGGDEALVARYRKMEQEQLEIVFDLKPPILSFGLGVSESIMTEARRRGILVAQMIGAPKHAKRAIEAGADLLVAQGTEAGGHTGNIGTFVLVPLVVDSVRVPVLAAGGVFDGRSLAAALMLGASGVWVGTRFATTVEARAHQRFKERILTAKAEEAILSKAFTGKQCRVIRNQFTEQWKGRESEILPFPAQREAIGDLHFAGRRDGNIEFGSLAAGQDSGGITEIKRAADVVREMAEQAMALLESRGRVLADSGR